MTQNSDLEAFFQQIRDFIGDRPVRLLTRKANSKKGSNVAYDTVFPKAPKYGTLQVFIRADEKEAITAVNVTELFREHVDFFSLEPTDVLEPKHSDIDGSPRGKSPSFDDEVFISYDPRDPSACLTLTRTKEHGTTGYMIGSLHDPLATPPLQKALQEAADGIRSISVSLPGPTPEGMTRVLLSAPKPSMFADGPDFSREETLQRLTDYLATAQWEFEQSKGLITMKDGCVYTYTDNKDGTITLTPALPLSKPDLKPFTVTIVPPEKD